MSSFTNAAKEAGVDRVVCPSCGEQFTTSELLKRFFKGVLEMVRRGQTVNITNFGRFSQSMLKGRSHKTPITPDGEVRFGDTWVLRFKPAQAAKKFLNANKAGVETGAQNRANNQAETEADANALKAETKAKKKAAKKKTTKKKAAKKKTAKKAGKK